MDPSQINNPETDRSLLGERVRNSIDKHDSARQALAGADKRLTLRGLCEYLSSRPGADQSKEEMFDFIDNHVADFGFDNLKRDFEWPQEEDAAPMWSMVFSSDFAGDEAFRKALLPESRGGTARLGNFLSYFSISPNSAGDNMLERVYSSLQAYQILKVIDPNLVETLHAVITRTPAYEEKIENILAFDEISDNGNRDNKVIHMLRQAYMIMGRLVSERDAGGEDIAVVLTR